MSAKKIAIFSAVTALLGVGSYAIWTYYLKAALAKKKEKDKPVTPASPATPNTPATPGTAPTPVTPSTPATPAQKNPFTDQASGDYFRGWVNKWHKSYATANQLDANGSYNNAYINSAWDFFKQEYCDSTGVCPLGVVQTVVAKTYKKGRVSLDIARIIKQATSFGESQKYASIRLFKTASGVVKVGFGLENPITYLQFRKDGRLTIGQLLVGLDIADDASNDWLANKKEGQWGYYGGLLVITIDGVETQMWSFRDFIPLLKKLGYTPSKYVNLSGPKNESKKKVVSETELNSEDYGEGQSAIRVIKL